MLIKLVPLLIILVTGFILHRNGSPYPVVLFTIHKLATILFAVLTAILVIRFGKEAGLDNKTLILTITGSVALLALLVSGGLLSISFKHNLMLRIHQVSTVIMVASAGGFLYAIL